MRDFLEINQVSFSYFSQTGEIPVLDRIHFHVCEGEFIAIVGPSGCGKTTLLSLLCGLLTPSSGEILLNGLPVAGSRSQIGYMLQKDHLLDWRSTQRNVSLGLEVSHTYQKEDGERIDKMLSDYGLSSFAEHLPSQLSGGMRQRAALIRTLLRDPSLLLLDEPFSALDYQTRLTVCEDVWHIIRKTKKTTLLITHDVTEAIRMADRILVLSRLPATILSTHTLPAELCRLSPMEAGSHPEFPVYFNKIWKELMRA